jgi:hypothetical protein
MITSKPRQLLQELSNEYYTRLQVVEAKAHQLVEFSQGGSHLTFTPHGLSHISAVERNYDWLIPEADLKEFNAAELFCLICATFFHDALMIPTRIGDEREARENHIQRARDFLIANRDALSLTIHESDVIAEVIRGHGVFDTAELPPRIVLVNEVIDIRKLGACLSLADICHADSSRAPEIVLRHLEMDEESAFHWRRHFQISGITRVDDSIVMSSLTFSEHGDTAVEEYRRAIEGQLEIVKPFFDTVLKPIRRVELEQRRLDSPLDQTLQFQANTPEILRILIEGVYEREDVFIRELVQNSLDSCLVRQAKQARRNLSYEPQVLITVYKDYLTEEVRALRVDDNGVGMDITDVQDTVLWIGSSISSNVDIVTLLQETLGKNLIATFGIGLLSCFKASNKITVRTQKESETPLQFTLTGVSDSIKPEKSTDKSVGTTIVVGLKKAESDFDVWAAITHYFRQITQVSLRYLELEWGSDVLQTPRDEIFQAARFDGYTVSPRDYFDAEEQSIRVLLHGDDFSGSVWMPLDDIQSVTKEEGSVDILNEGVFVTDDSTEDWLPGHVRFCDAVFNFSAGAISLPAGRDRVIKDEKFRSKQKIIHDKSYGIIDVLVKHTHHKETAERNFAALVLSHMYSVALKPAQQKLLKRLDDYQVRIYKAEHRMSLLDLSLTPNQTIYLQYPQGRWLSDLGDFDGKKLYHTEDNFVELQAAMMTQQNEIVIDAVQSDAEVKRIIEADLIKAYLSESDSIVVDLVSTNILEGKQRSKPLPTLIRQEVGSVVKFVQVPGLPNKRGWKVGNELWINLANPSMHEVYDVLQRVDKGDVKVTLASILFDLLLYRFDDSIQSLVRAINRPSQ